MHRSARIEYACLAAMELARRFAAGGPTRVGDIARAEGIPSGFLVQVLQPMKTAGIVESLRGAGGGYRLARPPEQISLAEVVRSVEGSVTSSTTRSNSDSASLQVLDAVWKELAQQQYDHLHAIRLSDLAARRDALCQTMYYI